MAVGFNGTLEYLEAVMNQFGSERGKYSEFLKIFEDFVNKVDGDVIIRRTKELFNGDEIMVTGFYNLLLDTKRKTKKPDDFWETYLVGKSMKQKNQNSYAKECDSEQNILQGHVEMDRMEDNNMTDHLDKSEKCTRHNCSTQPIGERSGNFASSIDDKLTQTKVLQTEGLMDNFVKTDIGDKLVEQNIDGKKKQKSHKRARDKRNGSLDEELLSNSSDTRPQKGSFVTEKESDTANNCPSPGEDLPISVLAQQSNYKTCTRSYRLLPENEKLKERCKSQPTALGASVLNNSWVSVDCRTEFFNKKRKLHNQREEMLLKLEDDRYELDMLVERVVATVKKVKMIKDKMMDNCINSTSESGLENDLTRSNLRCINQFYDHSGKDILEVIRKNDISTLCEMSSDLEKWEKCLRKCLCDFKKMSGDVHRQIYS